MKFDAEICKGVSCPECSFNKGKDGCLLVKRLDEIEITQEPCEDAVSLKGAIKSSAQPEPCEDAVSREAVNEWLKQYAQDVLHGKYELSLMYIWKNLMDLPSAQPEQRWTPVSEGLPKEKDAGILKKLGTSKQSEYVLATVEVKGERMTVTACTYDGEWDWNMKYAFPDYKIVAWMPLPEPYREDGEADETD